MTFEQIKQNIDYGDYNLLQKLLNVKTVSAARARFLRKDERAIKAMQYIQENKRKLIETYLSENNKAAIHNEQ